MQAYGIYRIRLHQTPIVKSRNERGDKKREKYIDIIIQFLATVMVSPSFLNSN